MARGITHPARAAAILALSACCLAPAGCGSPEAASVGHLDLLGSCVRDYHRKYGKPPDVLAQLEEFFGSPEEYAAALKNPLTGDDPGYLYVRPPAGVLDSSLSWRVVMLYQLRGGQKAEDLPVGYAAGGTGALEKRSITDTAAAWREFNSPGADCKVEFPAEPDVDAKDLSDITVGAKFCGLEYGLASRGRGVRTAAQLGSDAFLLWVQKSLAERLKSRVASSKAVRCGRHAGLAAALVAIDRDAETRVHWFLVGDRLICLSVSGPKGSLNDENAGRFFASLKLPDR